MNPEEILNLVQILRAGENISPMQSQPPGQLPTGEHPDLLSHRWDNSDPGRYTPDILAPESQYIRDALNIDRDTQRPQVVNPNAPTPPAQMSPRYVSPTANPSYEKPATEQPKQDGKLSGLEDYLQYFQKTLGDAPELDTKKRNQLAMVAAINALGQGLRQVVDYTGKVKHGAPINPQQDNLTGGLLSMYDKEMKEYEQRKDRYDLMKTNTMQDAFKYAYGDEKAREQYEKQLDLLGKQQEFAKEQLGKQQEFASEKAQQEAENRAALQKDKQGFDAAKLEYQRQADLDKLKTKYGYDVDLLNRRLSADAAKNAANVIEDQLKLAGDNVPVIDQKTGQSLVIPKELYWDVYQKIMNNPSAEMKKQMVQLMGADYQTSKQIVNGMIASEYRKFYEPQYDAAGQFQGWRMLDPNAPAPKKDSKTFWDFMPGALPGGTAPILFN